MMSTTKISYAELDRGIYISKNDLLLYLYKFIDTLSKDPNNISIKNTIQIIIDQIENIEDNK